MMMMLKLMLPLEHDVQDNQWDIYCDLLAYTVSRALLNLQISLDDCQFPFVFSCLMRVHFCWHWPAHDDGQQKSFELISFARNGL